MGWFAPLVGRRSRTSGLATPAPWLVQTVVGEASSASGVTVTETRALGFPAVWACVARLTGTFVSAPCKLYRRLNPGQIPDPAHPLYTLLHDLPNPEMTTVEFFEALQGHVELWGNAYAEIERDGFGRVVGLWPLRPDRMTLLRDANGSRIYLYRLASGQEVRWTWADPARQPAPILHVRGLGSDGWMGYAPLSLMRDALGSAIATDEYGARLFANNARPGGVLQAPGRLSKDAAVRLRDAWEAAHRGLSNANRVAVLEEGITWQAVGMNAEDAQFVQSRTFQDETIARIFGVPPHLVGLVQKSTSWGSGIEQQNIGYIVHTMLPRFRRWEQAIARDLLSVKSFETHFARFVVQGLLRGDQKTRYDAYAIGRQNGFLCVDEIRELEELNPLPDGRGQVYLEPLNMRPAGGPNETTPGATDDQSAAGDADD